MTGVSGSRYRPHPGEPHEWSHPIPQLAGGRACRTCGQLFPGSPSGPGPAPAAKASEVESRIVTEPYRACPRFDTCSVNRCPFDPEIEIRTFDPGDRETKCGLGKKARRALFAALPPGAQARLPFEGLYEAEWKRREARRRQIAAMTPEQRERQRRTLQAHAFRPRTTHAEALAPSGTPSDPTVGSAHAKARGDGGETA